MSDQWDSRLADVMTLSLTFHFVGVQVDLHAIFHHSDVFRESFSTVKLETLHSLCEQARQDVQE